MEVTNYLLTGMILQVVDIPSLPPALPLLQPNRTGHRLAFIASIASPLVVLTHTTRLSRMLVEANVFFSPNDGCFPKMSFLHPKSSILIGFFDYFHHPFWGTSIFGNTLMNSND